MKKTKKRRPRIKHHVTKWYRRAHILDLDHLHKVERIPGDTSPLLDTTPSRNGSI